MLFRLLFADVVVVLVLVVVMEEEEEMLMSLADLVLNSSLDTDWPLSTLTLSIVKSLLFVFRLLLLLRRSTSFDFIRGSRVTGGDSFSDFDIISSGERIFVGIGGLIIEGSLFIDGMLSDGSVNKLSVGLVFIFE